MGVDPNVKLGKKTGTGKLGDTIAAECKDGYVEELAEGGSKNFVCGAKGKKEGDDPEWQAAFKCVPLQCPALAAPANGKFSCKPPKADGKATDYGTKCTLSCNKGFGVSPAGAAVYTCDTTKQFTGTGKCVAQECSAPTVKNGKTDCSGSVQEGGTCKPQCDDGFNAQGEFKCSGGNYVKKGACAKEGTTLKVTYYVQGSLTMSIKLPAGKTAEQMSQDKEFMADVSASIAAGLEGINPDDVIILSITVVPGRRLTEAAVRKLASGKLKVDYKVKVKSEAAGKAVTSQITDNKEAFEAAFTSKLQEEAGVEVEEISAEPPQIIEEVEESSAGGAGSGSSGGDDASSDDGDGSGAMIGGIVGAIAGVGLLGFCFYMYTKKNSSQE